MEEKKLVELEEHTVEIVSDSGEGAQKASQTFARACAMQGNGLWTVELIPSEIQPPPHTLGSASGNRIRFSKKPVTNAGDKTDVVFAFNEIALLSRVKSGVLTDEVLVFIDSIWADYDDEQIRKDYRDILGGIRKKGGTVIEVPLEKECRKVVEDPRRGKNMFVLGLLGYLYTHELELLGSLVRKTFAGKSDEIIQNNLKLLEMGHDWGRKNLEFRYKVPAVPSDEPMVVMNGNQALALGAVAAGFKLCSMYPITPATSASHALSDIFEGFGGMVHQAEDEIAAIGVAVGSNYAGVPALTITSGPGLALKTEFQGLAVMTETPLVIVDVQRGGPSTGLPTKVEQSDLMAAVFGAPGDAPKVVMAASTIAECFDILTLARKIAEEFRMPVIVLSDSNLATGQQVFPRPNISEDLLPPPIDLSPVPEGTLPFDWDEETGLSKRLIPGQKGGASVITTLNHARDGKAVYDEQANQTSHKMRSRKLAALQKTLNPPEIYGKKSGDLLLVGWGSTRGAIEEGVDRAALEGLAVSSMHLHFLNPLPLGLKDIFSRFKKVMTVELNYSDAWGDPLVTEESRRVSQLCHLLRAKTLVDVDCWSLVPGRPLRPVEICTVIRDQLRGGNASKTASRRDHGVNASVVQ